MAKDSNHQSIENAKGLLFIPVIMGVYGIFFDISSPEILWGAALASFSCLLPIIVVEYKILSFVTIYSIMVLISFPIAAFANLLLEYPAVRPDLWQDTGKAMFACFLGMTGLAIGVSLSKDTTPISSTQCAKRFRITTSKFNFSLVALIAVVIIIKIAFGVYYHSSIEDSNLEAKGYLNILEHLTWLGYLGIFFQLHRFCKTRGKIDGLFTLMLVLCPVLAYLPSGNREQTFGILPILIVAYVSWEKRNVYRRIVLAISICAISALIIIVGIYRTVEDVSNYSVSEQYELIGNIQRANSLDPESLVISRLSDYVAVGRIMATTPNEYSFRYFSGIEDWWQIWVPGFLRPKGAEIHMDEGAETSLLYEISFDENSSSPVMTLGDLFSRFGYAGIVVGMVIIGFILHKFDTIWIQNEFTKIIFFILYVRIIWRLYTAPLLVNFIAFTREFMIIYVMSMIISRIANRYSEPIG